MLKHAVFIDGRCIGYQSRAFDGGRLPKDMHAWMKANIKNDWSWDDRSYPGHPSNAMIFRFASENDALLFKMRWG